MKLKNYNVQLHPLTPIHMGTGDKYEMFDFVMTEKPHRTPPYIMHRMNVLQAIKDILNPVDKLKIQEADGLKFLQTKIFKNVHILLKTLQQTIEIPISRDLYREYETYMQNEKQDKKQALNQWNIFRTACNGTNDAPYIPGSGIKGAIKTAVFSCKNKKRKHATHSTKDLLGGTFACDPFRHIKIADIHPIGDAKTHIQYVHRINSEYLKNINYKHDRPIKDNLTVRAEMIMPDEDTPYNGTITISDMSKTIKGNHKIDKEQIIKYCNDFYIPKLSEHIKILKKNQRLPRDMTDIAEQLQHDLDTLDKNSCIINIGKYGGAILKTMDGTRKISSRGKRGERPEILKEPKTMLVTGENKKFDKCQSILPLGWTILTISP